MGGSAIQISKEAQRVREQVSEAEWRLRCELAAAHRLIAHFVFADMTYNRVSVRVPGAAHHFPRNKRRRKRRRQALVAAGQCCKF